MFYVFFSLEHVSMKSRSFPGIMSLVSFFDLFFRPFFYVWKGPKRSFEFLLLVLCSNSRKVPNIPVSTRGT